MPSNAATSPRHIGSEAMAEADAIVGQILNPETDGNRYPLYERLREIAPVHKSSHPLLDGWYMIAGYDNCRTAMLAPEGEQNSMMLGAMNVEDQGVHDTMMRRWLGFRDTPEEHDVLRKFFFPHFTPRAIADARKEVRTLIDGLLDRIGDEKRFDAIGRFCFPLPSMVIARLLGIPMDDLDEFQQLMEERSAATARRQALESEVRARRDEIAGKFLDLFKSYLDKRRAEPADDLITKTGLASAEAGISDDDLLAQYVFILVAGHSTTADAIGNALIALDKHPEQRRLILEGKVEMRKAVDELMRWDSSIETTTRYIRDELTLDGVTIPAGTKSIMLFHSAHRDPTMFEDPDRLDLTRKKAQQAFPFGGGRHFCLGQALAKIEIEDALTAFLNRYPDYRVAEVEWQGTFVSHGPKRLIIEV